MTQKQFIEYMAEKDEQTKCGTKAFIEMFTNRLMDGVATDGEVRFPEFGKFEVRHHKARQGRDPRTGEEITIPARSVPVFVPAAEFKRRVAEAATAARRHKK